MGKWLGRLTGWLELFLEADCPLCQRSTPQVLCLDCRRQIQRCQLGKNESWKEPMPVFAWGAYGGALKQAIAALKYNNQPKLARPLGHWLAEAWLASPPSMQQSLTVVPIPMHADKQKQRGFNQADLLAAAFCEVTGLPLQQHGLTRVRATEAQFSLSPAAREENLTEAFQLGKSFHLRSSQAVLLLDDIYTTGATARTAMQVFQRHQIPVYGLAAIARAMGKR